MSPKHFDDKQTENLPVALFVEGRLEKAFVRYALFDRNPSWIDKVVVHSIMGLDLGDVKKLPNKLKNLRREKNRVLGIWLDAETDRGARFDQCRNSLEQNGLPVPNGEMEIASGETSTGILLMPQAGNTSAPEESSCFEQSLLAAYKNQDNLLCADKFLNCADTSSSRSQWRAKVKVQATWLAQMLVAGSQKPELQLEESFRENTVDKLWDLGSQSLQPVEKFIASLIEAASTLNRQ